MKKLTSKQFTQSTAIVFFLFWMIVLFAGADKPPPLGFLILFPLVGLCAYVVYRRLPTYINWQQTHRKKRYLFVPVDGAIAGLCVAALTYLIQPITGAGEPSITRTMTDHMIWICVLMLMGIINAIGVYVFTAVVYVFFCYTNNNRLC